MPRSIQYEDLTLAIELEQDGGYRVRTLSSPAGPAAEPFTLPRRRQELEEMIRRVGTCVRDGGEAADRGPARDLAVGEPRRAAGGILRETGALLFHSLFHGAVRTAYLWSRGRAASAADRGVRIRIVLPADVPAAGLLQALPWELLYCADTGAFLARDVLTPVVRILPLACVSPPFPAAAGGEIRILIVVAQPRGMETLDDADERARILEAWCRRQRATVKVLRAATWRDLYEALRSEHYQVVHFIAHGGFDAATGVGSVLLETPEGAAHPVSGEVLAETLQASRELRLVFLNTCKSARAGHRPGQDPLLAAAAALVRRGVQAVLAMQFPISDVAARIFSEAVYRSLARGSSIEAAVADGRVALYQANPEAWEWITPALFAALTESDALRPLCPAAEDGMAAAEAAIGEASRLLRARAYGRAAQVIEARLAAADFADGAAGHANVAHVANVANVANSADCAATADFAPAVGASWAAAPAGIAEVAPAAGASEVADLHYYLALALLGGRRPRALTVSELRPIEASAREAIGLAGCSAHHLCLMAVLQQDFYGANYLVQRPPVYEELLARAAAAPQDAARLAELVDLVPWAAPAAALIGARQGAGSR